MFQLTINESEMQQPFSLFSMTISDFQGLENLNCVTFQDQYAPCHHHQQQQRHHHVVLCLIYQIKLQMVAGRSGLAVTAVWEDRGLNPTEGSCMFIVNITTIYSLGHGLHTLTAVPRSTQPSTHRGMIKWVSAFGLSNNNKWQWRVWFLAAYRRTHSLGRLAWSEGRRLIGAVPYSSHEPGELSQWLWATMTAP